MEDKLPKVERVNPITEEVFFINDSLSDKSPKQPTFGKTSADLPQKSTMKCSNHWLRRTNSINLKINWWQ